MCGIVAVVRRRNVEAPADLVACLGLLAAAEQRLVGIADAGTAVEVLDEVAAGLAAADADLRGMRGLLALAADPAALEGASSAIARIREAVARFERDLDLDGARAVDVEALNAALVRCHDAAWAIEHDRLGGGRAVLALAGEDTGPAALEAYQSVQIALAALDRLEVRGRDSAGLLVFVAGHGLDLAAPSTSALLRERLDDPLGTAGAVAAPGGHLAFVYKTAAEIGELGDNTAVLRGQIAADELLRRALASEAARATVLAHTRWASVGIISEPNAHPLDSRELESGDDGETLHFVSAALNGDVDNYADLRDRAGLQLPPEVTTDAKVIPTLVARRLAAAVPLTEAFRSTVASFEGSVAIAALAADAPGRLLLAQRGSGQALYVGCSDDMFVVASEPYGLVGEASTYLRLDGETMLDPGDPSTQGQFVVLDADRAGAVEGLERRGYDGRALPVGTQELARPEITTRDVDRGDAPHYLLKEISEAPGSFLKTLRGKIFERSGVLGVRLPDDSLPVSVRRRLRDGAVRRVVVIGQGTAAVAGQSLAAALRVATRGATLAVEATTATELSGFGLADDMRDTLVVAISQSGTTTDTNRTVDLVRARGATVLAIVNRRNSDLVDKSDGVLYTSDGRDVEMSVASTKAFYAQVAAGFLLAFALAQELDGTDGDAERSVLLEGLRSLPDAMRSVLARRDLIAAAARARAPHRRSWAVVGNGANRVAAHEVRIKLSELCYKSIACDVTEDKKHIDLSAEPLILICAAGLQGSNADDVAKEVAIYRAHKAAPVVVCDEGEERFTAALETIPVPRVHPDLAFVLCTMAGHLFGYEAALAIDASARPLREIRGVIEAALSSGRRGDSLLDALRSGVEVPAARFFDDLRAGAYDGALEAATAVRVASLLRHATGLAPLDAYQVEFGKVGTPATLVDDLTAALTAAIAELTRPIDAIKHQAKTVTVGISRTDETLLRVRLVREVLAAGAARDSLTYRSLRTLVDLDPAVAAVTGYTRYRIEGDPARGDATVHVVDRGGIAATIPSRTEHNSALRGTKHRVASEREVTVVRGRADGRTLVMTPEVKGAQTTGITLLHVDFHDRLPADVARRVLQGYRDRYQAIVDQVTETEPAMRDEVLADIDLVELLTEPVVRLADRWRTAT